MTALLSGDTGRGHRHRPPEGDLPIRQLRSIFKADATRTEHLSSRLSLAMDPPAAKRAKLEAWTADANECTSIMFLDPVREPAVAEAARVCPVFTHQLFGEEEQIAGYRGLELALYLSQRSFAALAELKYEAKRCAGADDVLGMCGLCGLLLHLLQVSCWSQRRLHACAIKLRWLLTLGVIMTTNMPTSTPCALECLPARRQWS